LILKKKLNLAPVLPHETVSGAVQIVSGAVAERIHFAIYIYVTTVLTAFIYPVVVHWGWASRGRVCH
jgi:ammonia channel protein AmtB